MAAHSSILAWEIPWAEEPGGLQSMGLQRVGHDSSDYHFHFHFQPCNFEDIQITGTEYTSVWPERRTPRERAPGGSPV